jgi:bacterioferritin (cytochrome b1)
MGNLRPSDISRCLLSIASSINRIDRPNKAQITRRIGQLITALDDPGIVVPAENPEGNFACPASEIIAHLNTWLSAKYAIDIAYRSFADRIRGPWRDALVDHWYKHAEEERQHQYDLGMKIVAMGGDPIQTAIQIPSCTPNLEALSRTLMTMELEAIAAGRKTIQLAGENTSLIVMAENFVLIDTQHKDDLLRMSETHR